MNKIYIISCTSTQGPTTYVDVFVIQVQEIELFIRIQQFFPYFINFLDCYRGTVKSIYVERVAIIDFTVYFHLFIDNGAFE